MKLGWFLFLSYGHTGTILESSYGNMSAHKKIQLKAQNYELVVDRYLHPRMTGMHNYLPNVSFALIMLKIFSNQISNNFPKELSSSKFLFSNPIKRSSFETARSINSPIPFLIKDSITRNDRPTRRVSSFLFVSFAYIGGLFRQPSYEEGTFRLWLETSVYLIDLSISLSIWTS